MNPHLRNIYVCKEKKIYSFGKSALYTVCNVDLPPCYEDPDIVYVEKDPIFYLNISITNNCNLSCKHCLSNTTSRGNPFQEFTKEQIIDFVYRLQCQGLSNISITGGEPFLCKNIFTWLDELQKYNIDTKINTNGTLLDEKTVDLLVEYDNLTEMDISINGGENDSGIYYDKTNSIPTKIANINYLLSRNKSIDVFMSSVLSKSVLYSLDDIEEAIAKTGVTTWKLKDIHIPYDKIERIPDDLIPSKGEVMSVLRSFLSKPHSVNVIGYLVESINNGSKASRCENHGQRGFYISHTGDVLWMHSFAIKLGNIYHDSIPMLASRLTSAIEENPIPVRCGKCSSRYACFKSPYDLKESS